MSRGLHLKLEDLPERYQSQARAQFSHSSSQCKDTLLECNAEMALELASQVALIVVDPDCKILVRIVRVGGRMLDADNLQGGSKELRDAIASALGRLSDSEASGFEWEYSQEKGEDEEVRIEIYNTELTGGLPAQED